MGTSFVKITNYTDKFRHPRCDDIIHVNIYVNIRTILYFYPIRREKSAQRRQKRFSMAGIGKPIPPAKAGDFMGLIAANE